MDETSRVITLWLGTGLLATEIMPLINLFPLDLIGKEMGDFLSANDRRPSVLGKNQRRDRKKKISPPLKSSISSGATIELISVSYSSSKVEANTMSAVK